MNTPEPNNNIYAYCENKMGSFSEIQKEACKLDMCNLCCISMDSMKQKQYSLDNLRECYTDCNNGKLFLNKIYYILRI